MSLALGNEDMTEKVPCTKCRTLILPSTALKNDGLCMPCKTGNRENIEKAKLYYAKERELNITCPFRALWRELVDKVHNKPIGFSGLTDEEKMYFAVGVLNGETYNGGIIQFFDNSSGEYYQYAELGLVRLGANKSLFLLREAKKELFGDAEVPKDQEKRWSVMRNANRDEALDKLDTEYYKNMDNIEAKMESFAIETGLAKNA